MIFGIVFGLCSDCVQVVFELCSDCFRNFVRNFVRNVRFVGNVRNLFGLCSECVRNVFGMCSDCVRIVFGLCSDDVRIVFGLCSDCVRIVLGLCSEICSKFCWNVPPWTKCATTGWGGEGGGRREIEGEHGGD
jgi:hypothetical protein